MHSVIYDHQIFCQQQYGGISRYFCELAYRVNRSPGFSARVTAPFHCNIHLAECPVPKTATYLRMGIPGTGRLCRAADALLAPLVNWANSPSLIHRTYYAPVRKRGKVPVVITVFDMIHELFAENFPRGDTTSTNKRLGVRNADHVVCISESTASDLVRLFGVDRRKISVTHLGHSPIFQDTPRATETHANGRPYLLYVGQRAGYKNFDLALKAYASSKLLRDEFDLMAFGGPPFNVTELATIDNLRLRRDSVMHRTGADCDLALAYRGARALVYPSLYEGFGIPPLEAMSAGCAVTCSGTSSLPEVVGHAALLFDPVDIGSIRTALETVGLDDSVRTKLVAAGRERAGHFSWDRCAAETLAAYRKALTA